MVSKKTLHTLLAGAVALTVAGAAHSAKAEDGHSPPPDKEKCYGVAKAGKNDCASANGSHSCGGNSATDGDLNEWIALPAGTCEKLVGGTLTAGGAAPAEAAPAEAAPAEGAAQ